MITENFTNQQLPPHMNVLDLPERKENVAVADTKLRVLFYAGNYLLNQQEYTEGYHLGGRLFRDKLTVPNGWLMRGSLTPMQEAYMSTPIGLVAPGERKNYVQSYTISKQWNAVKMEFETITVGKEGMSAGLLFKKLYPSREVGSIVKDGVVEVNFFSNAEEIRDAQMFYFPDWVKYLLGNKLFPRTLREFRDQLGERREKTNDKVMRDVGGQFLRSCDEFLTFAQRYVKNQTEEIEAAKKTAGYQIYDERAEKYFTLCEITREDKLVQGFAQNQNQSNDAIAMMAESVKLLAQIAANSGLNQPPPQTVGHTEFSQGATNFSSPLVREFETAPPEILDETQAEDEAETVQIPEGEKEEVTAEMVQAGCQSFTKNNEPCAGRVQKAIGGKGFCASHPKKEKTSEEKQEG